MVSCGTSDIIKTVVFIENTAPLLQQIPRKPRIFHEKPQIWNIITLLQNLDINSSFFFSSSAGFLFCCLNFSKYFALFFSSLSASNIPIIIHARSRAYLIIGLSLNFVWSDVFFFVPCWFRVPLYFFVNIYFLMFPEKNRDMYRLTLLPRQG